MIDGLSGTLLGTVATQSAYAAVAAVFALVLSTLRHPKSAVWRAGLWSLVLVRLVLPVDLASPVSLGELLPAPEEITHAGLTIGSPEGAADAPMIVAEESAAMLPLVLLGLWLAGAVVLGLRHLWLRRRIATIARRASDVEDPFATEMMDLWRSRIGIDRPVRLRSADRNLPPFTIGLIRPVVFLPHDLLSSRDPVAIEATIAHELNHVKKIDDLWLQLAAWIRIVWFFHPAAWLAERRFRECLEEMCDESVLRFGQITPHDYGRGLLSVLSVQLARRSAGVMPAMAATRKDLIMRFQHIVSYTSPSGRTTLAIRAATILLAALILPMGPMATSGVASTIALPTAEQPESRAVVRIENPVPGARVTANWGEMKDPWNGEKKHHRGLDLAAPRGTAITAPADGTVVMAKVKVDGQEALGTVVILDHGKGLTTSFSHLGELRVSEGDRVATGDTIATIGTTGKTTGPHVHFEVHIDGDPVDPETMME